LSRVQRILVDDAPPMKSIQKFGRVPALVVLLLAGLVTQARGQAAEHGVILMSVGTDTQWLLH
jgi:hypothetical protein